jgi:hypothetical protein
MTTEPKTKIQDAQDCITVATHLLRLMEIASEELEMGTVLDGVEIRA